jgi:hypothetical protein
MQDFRTESGVQAMIDQYANSLPAELQDATRDVYVRAYRRAGLLPGNPDEIGTRLPALRNPEKPVECDSASASAAWTSDAECPPGPGTARDGMSPIDNLPSPDPAGPET